MIPQYTDAGDVLSSEAVMAVSSDKPPHSLTHHSHEADNLLDNFSIGQLCDMDVAAEVVVTTEQDEHTDITCQFDSMDSIVPARSLEMADDQTILQNSTTQSPLKRPTFLLLDYNIRHKHQKTRRRCYKTDLSIFNGEEPHIVEDEKSFTTCEMDVGAQEEVVTDPVCIGPSTENNDCSEATTESLDDSAYGSEGDPSMDDSLRSCLTLSPDTEKALVTFTRFGDTEILLPIVKRGPGFDLIDFINNDFPYGEEISSLIRLKDITPCGSVSSNSRTSKCKGNRMYKKKQPKRKRKSDKKSRQRNMSSKKINKNSLSDNLNRKETAYLVQEICTLNDYSNEYWNKRIKNNLSSKISREKRKMKIQMKFIELESLKAKNSKLKKLENKLKKAIKKLNFEISQMKIGKMY